MLTFHTLLKGLDIYLTHSQPIQHLGAKTWSAQLSSYHKRQIPGVGRNVYVWQLNAVRPTTGLILHPGNGGHKSLKRKTSRSLLPCLWLPPDALSLDAPWCWSSSSPTELTFSFMRLMFAGISLFPYWIKFFVIWALSWVNLDGDLSSLWGRWRDVWCPTVSPRADRLNRSQVINWSNQLGSFSTQFWLEGRGTREGW